MYLRRKVFSLGGGYDYLDLLEERAFSEGYVQRMFDEKEENEKPKGSILGKTLAIGGGLAGLGYGGLNTVHNGHIREKENAVSEAKKKLEQEKELAKKKIEEGVDKRMQHFEKAKNDALRISKNPAFDLQVHYIHMKDEAKKAINYDQRWTDLSKEFHTLDKDDEFDKRIKVLDKELREETKKRIDPNIKQKILDRKKKEAEKYIEELIADTKESNELWKKVCNHPITSAEDNLRDLEEGLDKTKKSLRNTKLKAAAGFGLGAAAIGAGLYLNRKAKNKNKKED